LIESEWREAESGHRRKYYRLLPKGRKALHTEKEQWLAVHKLLKRLWKTEPRLT
jgi:DNA-binding PadR family transcriptional regulator